MSNLDSPDFQSVPLGPSQGFLVNPVQHSNLWEVTVPAAGRLVNVQFSIETDATAGNRTLLFEILDGSGNQLVGIVPPNAQPPSSTWEYTIYPGAGFNQSNPGHIALTQYLSLPANLVVQNGWKLVAAIENPGATDSANTFTVVLSPS